MPRKGIVRTDPLYWMPVNVQEWLNKIAGSLTTEQFGAATLLLFTAWGQKPPCTLPSDSAFLAGKSGIGARWSKNAAAVLGACEFYAGRDGRLRAEWLQKIHAEQLERYEHRSKAGKENRSKRDQTELTLISGTNGRANGTTKRGTIGTTNTFQNEKGEGVAPTGLTPEPQQHRPPDAPAPEGARAGSSPDERPVEDRTVPRHDRRPFRLTDIVPTELRPKAQP